MRRREVSSKGTFKLIAPDVTFVGFTPQYGLTSPDQLNAETMEYLCAFVSRRRQYGPTLREAWARYIRQ